MVLRLNFEEKKPDTFPLVLTIVVIRVVCALLLVFCKFFSIYKEKKKEEEEDDVVLLYRNSIGKINEMELDEY